MNEKLRSKAASYRPAATVPLRQAPNTKSQPMHALRPLPASGEPRWHGVMGVRFALPLPEQSKGPIRARDTRRSKGTAGY